MLQTTTALNSSSTLSTTPIDPLATTTTTSLTTDAATTTINRSSATALATTTPTITPLSTLNWASVTNGWGTVEKNRSNGEAGATDGNVLTLNGVTYTSGLGVHANSDITYNLNGQYTRFVSDIGVDDEVGNFGSVVFQVWADNAKIYDSSLMTGSSATKTVDVDLTGKQALRLVVTDGGNGNGYDHADWANAHFLGGTASTTPTSSSTTNSEVALSGLNWTTVTNGWGTVEKNRSNGEAGATDGNVLTLNGQTYTSGLGVHANSDITYNLNGQYTRFRSDIGVDDEVGSNGSVTFQVWADSTKLYDSGVMTGSTATKAIDLDLTGKQALRLVVTDGGNGNGYDHADWANARLLGGAVASNSNEVTLSSLNWSAVTNGWGTVEKNRSNGEAGAADGNVLTLNGQTYTSGLGVHANSDITYNLNGQYTRFRSDIGVDDEVGSNGSVTFQVWADGTKLYDSGVMTGSTATKAVDLDLTGKQSLRLVVTDGGNGNGYDHADWANARLLSGGGGSTTPLDVNDRPTITLTGGSTRAIAPNGSLPITGLAIADPDAGTGTLTVTVQATNGKLTINGGVSGGISLANITNNGTNSVTLRGTLAQINATLANATGLTYRPNTGYQGTDSLNITVNDNGNTGTGGALTATQSLAIAVNSTTATSPNANSPVGINLSELEYYTTSWPFVDAFKLNGGWISQKEGTGWGGGGSLNLRADGYIASLAPGQYAETLIYYDSNSHFPGGNYTVLYDGEGRLEFAGDTVVSRTPGRMVVNIKPDGNGINLQLRETNPANPVRNIRVIMPGFENTYQTQPFHPLFLERLSPFKTLRFMDWMNTNGSPVDEWSDRTTLTSFNQTNENGVALEHMIQLANTLKADPWFNIPHAANDDYVRQFATMVRDQLDPSLKVRIEYSNEVWNYAYGFSQTQYAQQKGLELGLTTDMYDAPLFYYAKRAVEVFKIFEEVFGGTDRLVRVLASQAVNPAAGEKVLSWQNAYQHADAYAIAGYFGIQDYGQPQRFNQLMSMTSDQIIDQVMVPEINTFVKDYITNSQKLAQKYGLPMVGYEGGNYMETFTLSPEQEPLATAKLIEVSRNPKMRDVYREFLEMWENIGGGMFNQFNDTYKPQKWGQWGLLEYQDQPLNMAPEYQGVVDYIQQNPRPGL